MKQSPWAVTSLALEAYRKRLIAVLNLIDDAAYGTSEISSSAVSDAFDSVVDYLFDGEEAFNKAYSWCQEALEKGNRIEQLDAEILRKQQLVSEKLSQLRQKKSKIQQEISEGRKLLYKLYSARSVPFTPENVLQLVYRLDAGELPPDWKLALLHPEEYKAKEAARLAAESETGPTLLPGRRLRRSDESVMEDDEISLHPSAESGMGIMLQEDLEISEVHEVYEVQEIQEIQEMPPSVPTYTAPPPPLPPTLPPRTAPSAPPQAPPSIPISAIPALLAKLPPEGKTALLKAFPAGWKPGDPTPTIGPELRAMLAQYMNAPK